MPINKRTKQDIMEKWKDSINQPIVSICTTTYNHENYIAKALNSFLMQETEFPFEVLIHDDCSTDNTANIIREYTKKYPNIIKPIYQMENQYSKGIKPDHTFNFPRAKGTYIARCEGDDYWVDPLKLQKQIDFLEENDDFSICATQYYENKYGGHVWKNAGHYNFNNLIMGNIVGTATMVFRKKDYTDTVYDFVKDKPFGDWPLLIMLSKKGRCMILKDITAVYNIHEGGVYSNLSYFDQRLLTFKAINLFYKDKSFSIYEKSMIYKSARQELKNIFRINPEYNKEKIMYIIKDNKHFIGKYEQIILEASLKINSYLFRIITRGIL